MNPIRYIPFLRTHPPIREEMMLEFERFYDNQRYILSDGLEQFEREYAAFNQVKHAIGTGNGHDALLIILKSLNIGKGDEVIVPAHTFIATALSVINAGATPVLVDVDDHTCNISPTSIGMKISKKTRAIVPVHLYGNPADMSAIIDLAIEHNIPIIEDNAQAQGAEVFGRKTGSLGVMNFTSFYPTKNIGALGDAGMITTDSDVLAEKARMLRNYGKSASGSFEVAGINSRLDELQARLLSVKLRHLNDWNLERMKIARHYEARLGSMPQIRLQKSHPKSMNVRHIFPVFTSERDALKNFLAGQGIETLVHYPDPLHLHPALSFLKYQSGGFPVAEKICKEELSLPIYPGLDIEEINFICDKIKAFFNH